MSEYEPYEADVRRGRNTFVAPLANPPAVRRMTPEQTAMLTQGEVIQQAPPLKFDSLFAEHKGHVVESTSQRDRAYGLAARLAMWLSVILILAITITVNAELDFWIGALIFAVLGGGAITFLSVTDHRYSLTGIQRHRDDLSAKTAVSMNRDQLHHSERMASQSFQYRLEVLRIAQKMFGVNDDK